MKNLLLMAGLVVVACALGATYAAQFTDEDLPGASFLFGVVVFGALMVPGTLAYLNLLARRDLPTRRTALLLSPVSAAAIWGFGLLSLRPFVLGVALAFSILYGLIVRLPEAN